MSKKNQITDYNKRLSQSKIWALQREYFDNEGVSAWDHGVPFYVTSNPFIAHSYAKVLLSFIEDWVRVQPQSLEHTFYILELGTGSGCFSYYFLKELSAFVKSKMIPGLKVCYVMTDFTLNNLNFWQENSMFTDYLCQGILDFATFDLENPNDLELVHAKKSLNKETVVNPMMVVANYIFDTVSHDCFKVNHGQVQEVLYSLKYEKDKTNIDFSNDLHISNSYRNIEGDYYEDEYLNQVLMSYKDKLNDTHMLIPISGLGALNHLLSISEKLVLLSSDKAYTSLGTLDHLKIPGIAAHGSFSVMVNFHAIGEYFKVRGGNVFFQTERTGINTILCMSGIGLDALPRTRAAANAYIEELSPSHYFTLHQFISRNIENCNNDVLASYLSFARWDPHVFKKMILQICKNLGETSQITVDYLRQNLPKIAENVYNIPYLRGSYFAIAYFFHQIQDYQTAIEYYQQSLRVFGPQHEVQYNLQQCMNAAEEQGNVA